MCIRDRLWTRLHSTFGQVAPSLIYAPWPKPLDDEFKGHYGLDDCYLEMVDAKYDLVSQGRNLRREANIPANKKAKFIFKPVNFTPPQDVEEMCIRDRRERGFARIQRIKLIFLKFVTLNFSVR